MLSCLQVEFTNTFNGYNTKAYFDDCPVLLYQWKTDTQKLPRLSIKVLMIDDGNIDACA